MPCPETSPLVHIHTHQSGYCVIPRIRQGTRTLVTDPGHVLPWAALPACAGFSWGGAPLGRPSAWGKVQMAGEGEWSLWRGDRPCPLAPMTEELQPCLPHG